MFRNPEITQERLRELLNYDPETGLFHWRVGRGGTAKAGSLAGSVTPFGYVSITVDRTPVMAHRLAWFWVHGRWPTGLLDHKDTIKSHNWINNLRPADKVLNAGNAHAHRDNQSGLKGAYLHKPSGRWHSRIRKDGVVHYLGYFSTPEAAHQAYRIASQKLFGEFARFD